VGAEPRGGYGHGKRENKKSKSCYREGEGTGKKFLRNPVGGRKGEETWMRSQTPPGGAKRQGSGIQGLLAHTGGCETKRIRE